MFNINTHIEIGQYVFDYCCDVDIVTDIDTLTDTCKITVPRRFNDWDGRLIALGDDPILKRKDKVLVKAGYDGNFETQFIGYIRDIKPGVPVTIDCEDSMMLLKQTPLTKTFAAVTLKQLLTAIVPAGIKFVCNDVPLGEYRYTKINAAKILEDLRSRYGLFSYFRIINDEPVLYSGLAYWTDNRQEADFIFGETIIDAGNLEYKNSDDARLKVVAKGINKNNTKIELEVGDPDGDIRTVFRHDIDAATLRKFAESELARFKYTGYHGSFTTFGEPSIQKGDVVNLIGNQYHPNTRHLVPKITKQIGVSRGYKQIIEPRELLGNGK